MFRNYLKIAIRSLRSNKFYSFINMGGLLLGIFGSIIIFQLVKYHLGTDTYHRKAENIYRVVMDLHLDDAIEHEKGSPFILHETLKNEFSGVETAAYIGQQEMTISISKNSGLLNKYLEKEAAAFIDEEYFKIFDYQWKVGTASSLNIPNTVIVTEKYAKKYFGNDDPIDKIVRINNLQDLKVVGVLKDLPGNTDLKTEVFVSLPTIKTIMPDYGYREWSWFTKTRETYILLKNGTSKQNFESQLPAFSRKYYGEMAKYYQFHLQRLSDIHFNMDYDGKIKWSSILFFSVIGMLLIVIGCINFINLTTAQSFKRFKEIGVRKTLGSSRLQLFWQFITEVAMGTIVSVIVAVFLAYLATPTINNWLNVQITFSQFFDFKVLVFTGVLILFIIITAGLYPSLVISGYNPLSALKGISKGAGWGGFLRKGLVITQFSISFVLIAVSILIVLQINFLGNKDIGTAKDLILHVKIPNTEGATLATLKNRLLQKPFVQSVSFSSNAPSSKTGWGGSIKYENRDWERFVARSRIGDEDYLETYNIKIVSGRKPVASDTIREVLINRKLVSDLGLQSPEEALNKRLVVGDASDGAGTIVGVVNDFNTTDLYTGIEPAVIFSSRDRYKQTAIRLSAFNSKNTIAEIESIWESVYPDNVFEHSFYDEELARFYQREELIRNLVVFFTMLSVFISCLGLFGLVSCTISQRTKEIGIRKVLGAGVASITILLSKDFLKLVVIAIIIASPIAYYFMFKWLQDFAYRVNISWWIFLLSGFAALLISLVTVSFRAIKAAGANPVKSLRTE